MKTLLALISVGYLILCGALILESGLVHHGATGKSPQPSLSVQPQPTPGCILLGQTNETGDEQNAEEPEQPEKDEETEQKLQADSSARFGAKQAARKKFTLGSTQPGSRYKLQIELDSLGAAIRTASFTDYDNRDRSDPQPLVFLSPVPQAGGREILSMANRDLVMVQYGRAVELDTLRWESSEPEPNSLADGTQTATFTATIIDANDTPVVGVTKTYTIAPDSFLVDCQVTVRNLTESAQEINWNLAGPAGPNREGFRSDLRKVVAAFADKEKEGQFHSVRLEKKHFKKQSNLPLNPRKANVSFLWAAAVNKYFAAILVPQPDQDKQYCDWVIGRTATFYNPDADTRRDSGDEAVGLDIKIAATELTKKGEPGDARTYGFRLYIGPKDKSLFDKNEQFRKLGFAETIDFPICCCPSQIIEPLAFTILAIMKWMYSFIGNYGVVIIILVFLIRLVLHPITKKSQISMSKMSKLAPAAEAIKKKYAGNKQEMNKHLMELYREQGASPIMGMLPMFVQMPIWIALWSAVYTSVDLRGKGFLPFWITDLSVPDALYTFSKVIVIPLLNWKIESLNILPILMGVAFYLQQKLMPSQASIDPKSQAAQQQKMMMIMMPLLFPLMLYKAPSGVNLYIMASTFAGVVEQYVIRKHIREKDQAESKGLVPVTSKTGGKVKKKKPKPFYRT